MKVTLTNIISFVIKKTYFWKHFTPHAMDYSFLGDPEAIAEILATAEPEHRAMQSAEGWDDKTLAIHIATCRNRGSKNSYAQEEHEWKERVLRMSDEDLEMEDDVIRAKVEADGLAEYRAMSDEERGKAAHAIIKKLKWSKVRLAFTKQERESREEKKRYLDRLQHMSPEVYTAEIDAITEQLAKLNEEILGLPFNAELSEENKRKAKIIEAKYKCLLEERKRRAEK